MDPAHLTTKLVRSLSQIVPNGFRVYERDGMVMIDARSYPTAAEVADIVDQAGDLLELVETAAWGALSTVQDFISETTTRPWPETGRMFLPIPKVQVSTAKIEWWFEGESGNKVLEVPTVRW